MVRFPARLPMFSSMVERSPRPGWCCAAPNGGWKSRFSAGRTTYTSIRSLWVLGIVLLAGCGGGTLQPAAIGFVNQTRHSDAQLRDLWTQAQGALAQQIDLNPLQRTLHNAPPQILPGDARAWNISPHQLTVAAQPDVSSQAYLSATGNYRGDPTGMILCPQPCNVNYAPAYSVYSHPASRYAASWESSDSNFDFLVQYEFENQILKALGYDVSWR